MNSEATYRRLANKVLNDAGFIVCQKCGEDGAKDRLEAHHKDKDISNNILKNLKRLCCRCHRKLHQLGTKHKKESKQQISETLRKNWKEGKFDKRVLDHRGEKNPMYGKKKTAKQIAAIKKIGGWNKGLKMPKLSEKSKLRKRNKKGRCK